jgi:tetratricopeptide (TPR) repeat protein
LSQRLAQSGFLGIEDWTVEPVGCAGFTSLAIRTTSLQHVTKALGDAALMSILEQVAWGLEQLHRLDFVHCDLKPTNILLEIRDCAPVAWIADLDWAVRRGTQRPLTFRGTHPYAAPEVSDGHPLHEATDVYSFGQILQCDVIPLIGAEKLQVALQSLSERCVEPKPNARIASFGLIRNHLATLERALEQALPPRALLPAVRDAGLRSRARNLMSLSERTSRTLAHGVWVTAPPGGGKSRVMREAGLQRQLAGRETLRVEGVRILKELHASLVNWCQTLRSFRPGFERETIVVFAESDTDADFEGQTWPGMAGVQLVVEGRWPERLPREMTLCRVPPWTRRECIAAIGHLHDNAPLANINGEAISVASGGIPWLAIRQLRGWMCSARRSPQSEPLNIDRLDAETVEYWGSRLRALTRHSQEVLQRAAIFHDRFNAEDLSFSPFPAEALPTVLRELEALGWLSKDDTAGQYRIVCRSARNYLRTVIPNDLRRQWAADALLVQRQRTHLVLAGDPTLWDLACLGGVPAEEAPTPVRDNFVDTKLSAFAHLCQFRRTRHGGTANHAAVALVLSRAFERLGSTVRQKRWAVTALQRLRDEQGNRNLDLSMARLHCELFQLAVEPDRVGECIEALLRTHPSLAPAVKGYLLSALGGFHLWLTQHQKGGDLCHQAHHLLEQAAPESEEYARNLNRLGLASSRAGRNDSAKRYLLEGLQLATAHGFASVAWRCHGNLGVVARDLGEPEIAMDCSRQVMRYCRETGQIIHYLSALMNRSLYLVDMGRGFHAARAARHSLALAEMLSDQVQMGHSTNNMGWILTMQGEVGAAHRYLMESIRLRRRVGDKVSEAHAVLNLAWLALLVRYPRDAEELAASTLDVLAAENHQHGLCEAHRIRAAAAMQDGRPSAAEGILRGIPLSDPGVSPRDRAETEIALAQIVFAERRPTASAALLETLRSQRPVLSMFPLLLDYRRMEGLSFLYSQEYDRSYETLSSLAGVCRISRRIDRLIETMGALIELARRMGNMTVARRYLNSAQSLIDQMRRDIPCRLTRNE